MSSRPVNYSYLAAIVAILAIAGCEHRRNAAPAASDRPRVRATRPERRTIERTVGQPAFIEAYEQTSIYPKIAGYIEKWDVDIGDRIKKDQLLATLIVPELQAEFERKKAEVAQDEVLIKVAEQLVKVADHKLNVSMAELKKSQADLGAYQAAVDRWQSEVKRLSGLVDQKVVDKQVLEESQKQLKSNVSARDAASAGIEAAEAVRLARQADVEKARVDVEAARAKTTVSQAEARRYAALVSYTQLTAPYDGVVVVRNANTGDFVQPAGGDRSVERNSDDPSTARVAPVYVVARTDLVRVFVDVPEIDANHVAKGTEARIRVQALDDLEIQGAVTRTSWSLHLKTRTLRAEVDLPNPKTELLPGMYAYASVLINRPDVFTLPLGSVVELGNQKYCYLLEHGRAAKTAVRAGVSDGTWIEVSQKQINGEWLDFTGDEQVLTGNLEEITDGQAVSVSEGEEGRASSDAPQEQRSGESTLTN